MRMPERKDIEETNIKVGLLGASFDTGNLGVSALAESSIKVILNRWPNAEIILLGSGYVPGQHRLFLMGEEIFIRTLPIRFSKNIFLPYHFLWFAFYGLLARVLPKSRLRNALVRRNSYFKILFDVELVADITGGDSFSDIYGFRRFFLGFLCKWLIIFLGKNLILLPQTYGPFNRSITRMMARYIINHAGLVYSRDKTSIGYVKDLLGNNFENGNVKFVPDVAFVLDVHKSDNFDMSLLQRMNETDTTIVGLNISGLLFNGGYTRDNMFGLKIDYRDLVGEIVELLMQDEKVVIILIPHVFPPAGYEVESDPVACRKVYESLKDKYKDRLFPVQGEFNHNEIKYIIGLCDFFVGSRMHSCISALSQCIPAVGLAYSDKFGGVFQTVGMEEFVIDMRQTLREDVLNKVDCAFKNRFSTVEYLKRVIPDVQRSILSIFEDIP